MCMVNYPIHPAVGACTDMHVHPCSAVAAAARCRHRAHWYEFVSAAEVSAHMPIPNLYCCSTAVAVLQESRARVWSCQRWSSACTCDGFKPAPRLLLLLLLPAGIARTGVELSALLKCLHTCLT
jgi:hypothetical protein